MPTSLKVESWLDTGEQIGTAPIAAQAKQLEELDFDRAYKLRRVATLSCLWCSPPTGPTDWTLAPALRSPLRAIR